MLTLDVYIYVQQDLPCVDIGNDHAHDIVTFSVLIIFIS